MSVPVTIPDTAAYEEHVFADGEVDFVIAFIREGDYLFGTTLAGNKMMRLDRNNLATNTVLDFGGGPAHIRQVDMAYVRGSSAAQDRIYVVAAGDSFLTISSVNPNPTPMTFTDVITEAGGQGSASIATDNTYLYAIRDPDPDSSDTIIYRYTLDGSFTKTTLTLTGYRRPKCIRTHGGFVYVTGFQTDSSATTSWLAKVNTTTFALDTATRFERGSDPGATINDLAITPMHVWIRDAQGKVQKCPIANITSFEIIDTGFASDCTAVSPDGAYCWAVFENGKAVRINTSTNEQRVYTLNPGQNYFGNIALDNENIYAVRHEVGTVVSKYAIDTEPGAWQWDFQPSAASFSSEYATGVASDSSGNIFVQGFFESAGIYLAKFSPSGEVLWSRGFSSTNGNTRGIAVDANGDVFIVGEYIGTANFGGDPLPGSLSAFSIYICKCSGVNGGHLWSRGFKADSFQLSNYGINVAVGSDGHPVITGQLANANFGGASIGSGVYLVKLHGINDGDHIWSKGFGAGRGRGIGIDSLGNIWITGYFLQSINFGGDTITSEGYGMFIAKFNSSGDHQYSFGTGNFGHVNGEYPCGGHGLAIDPTTEDHQDDIALAIGFSGSINIGGSTHTKLPNNATPHMLFARFNKDGTWLWETVVPGEFQNGYGAAVDLNGNMLFAGINAGGNFGQGVVQGATFIAKYSQEGTLLWVKTYSTAQPARSIAATPAGNMAITGAYSNPVDFGGGERTPTGRVDLWVLQLGP